MLSKFLIQFSVEGRGCVPSLLFDLRPNYGGDNEVSLPETPEYSWVSLGQSAVGPLLLSPGSWCTQGSVCAPQESVSQSCVSSGGSMVGLMATSSKRAYVIPRSAAPEPLPLEQSTADLHRHRRCSNTVVSVSVGSLGPGAHKVCLSPLSISGGYGV